MNYQSDHDAQTLARARAAIDQAARTGHAPILRPRPPRQGAPTFPPLEALPDCADAPAAATSATALAKPQHRPAAVVLACGADLHPAPIRWLWPGWLALGKLHILAGAPGQGKTTIAMALAATVTAGGQWPDGRHSACSNVLVWSGEDDPADTLLPRLLAAGADRGRCYFIAGTRADDGSVRPFDPAQDLPGLRQQIECIGGVRLLVVDPVVSAVTGDSHKNTEVRRSLQPLVDLAAAVDCAVLGITHFAKGGQGQDPAQRVVGSVAFTAVARVVMVAAKVQARAEDMEKDQQGDRRILARSKSNIGPDAGGFEYYLEQIEVMEGIQTSRIAWGKTVEGSARELLTDPDGEPDEARDVAGFLRAILSDGPMSAKDIFKDADGAGYSRDSIKRASLRMGIEKRKTGMKGGWEWALHSDTRQGRTPEGSMKGAKNARLENVHSSHSSALPSVESTLPASFGTDEEDGQEVPL